MSPQHTTAWCCALLGAFVFAGCSDAPPKSTPTPKVIVDLGDDQTSDMAVDMTMDASMDATQDAGMDMSGTPDMVKDQTMDQSPTGGLAQNISVNAVEAYQSVRVALVEEGQQAGDLMPIVSGRETLFRIWVAPRDGWQAKPLELRLMLTNGQDTKTWTVTKPVSGASTVEVRDSVFEVRVPGQWISPQTRWQVALWDQNATGADGPSEAQWPRMGQPTPLGATDAPGALRLVIVPLTFEKNGTVLEPDTSPAQLARFQQVLEALYPATQIDIRVRESIAWTRRLNFGNINSEMRALKQSDMADDDVFYYGLIRPDVDFSTYCSGRCTTGQSFTVSSATATSYFVGSGVGFTGERWAWTLAHEMGHMHGRGHAPCDVSFFSQDRNYPHRGGVVGIAGWDKRNDVLITPNGATDFMGYCDDLWVSDYTYQGIYDRRVAIAMHTGLKSAQHPPKKWRALSWDRFSAPMWSSATKEPRPETGRVQKVVFYQGRKPIHTQMVPAFSMSHDDAEGVMIPEPPKGATSIEFGSGRRVALPTSF